MDQKTLDVLAKEERTRYYREWRKKNPDKVKKHNQNYWKKRVQAKMDKEKISHTEKPKSRHPDNASDSSFKRS